MLHSGRSGASVFAKLALGILIFVLIPLKSYELNSPKSYSYGSNLNAFSTYKELGIEYSNDTSLGTACTHQIQCNIDGLICNQGICTYCNDDNQCKKINSQYKCKFLSGNSSNDHAEFTDVNNGRCLHKDIFEPYSVMDFLSSLIIFIGSAIAAGAGIGGGGLNSPILLSISKFPHSVAIPLSSVCITGSAFFTYVESMRLRRSGADRPLADHHTILLIQPLALGGSMIGVLLNKIFPEWFTLGFLLVTLTYTIYKTGHKTWTIWKGERMENKMRALHLFSFDKSTNLASQGFSGNKSNENSGFYSNRNDMGYLSSEDSVEMVSNIRTDRDNNNNIFTENIIGQSNDIHNTVTFIGGDNNKSLSGNNNNNNNNIGSNFTGMYESGSNIKISIDSDEEEEYCFSNEELFIRDSLEYKETVLPWKKILLCIIILIVICVHSIIIGGRTGNSIVGVVHCSKLYWALFFMIYPLLFIGVAYIAYDSLMKYRQKIAVGFRFQPSDIHWSIKNIIITVITSFLCGILSSLLGIGGGMIITPLLLGLKVAPDTTAASSSVVIFYTSLVAVVQFGVIGRIPIGYGVYYFFIGYVASIIGNKLLNYFVKKYNSKVLILLCMLIIAIPSSILLVISEITSIVARVNGGVSIGMQSLCK